MIHRRITEHVKAQNWFAVFLDFTIVVAGILITLQITIWNEVREADALRSINGMHAQVQKILEVLDKEVK
ncbi:MAG: hypothetical protein KJN99_14350 [Marinicaulis sp.]|nr:hypothetical protein [Marinicaulis sp.]